MDESAMLRARTRRCLWAASLTAVLAVEPSPRRSCALHGQRPGQLALVIVHGSPVKIAHSTCEPCSLRLVSPHKGPERTATAPSWCLRDRLSHSLPLLMGRTTMPGSFGHALAQPTPAMPMSLHDDLGIEVAHAYHVGMHRLHSKSSSSLSMPCLWPN